MIKKPMTTAKNEVCIGQLLKYCHLEGNEYLVGDEQIFGYWGIFPFPSFRENPDDSTFFESKAT